MAKETQPEQSRAQETQSDQGHLPYDTVMSSYRPRTLQREAENSLINEASRRGRASLALMHSAVSQVKELTGIGPSKPESGSGQPAQAAKKADMLLVMNRVRGTSERKASTIVMGEMPEQTKKLISGIYWWLGAQEVARQRSEENPDEVIVWRRGRYNARDIFARERQMLKNPDFGNLPTFEITLMGEDAEGVPIKGKTRVASGILLDKVMSSRQGGASSDR